MRKYKVSKEFRWDMSHRLRFHDGLCKNIHGHAYKLRVEVEGSLNEKAMVVDFYDLKRAVAPLVEKLDHCFICDKSDELTKNFLKENDFKYYELDGYTTAENIAAEILRFCKENLKRYSNLTKIKIRLHETADSFAEIEEEL